MKNLRCLKKFLCILLLAALTLPLQAISVEKLESAKVLKTVDGDTLKVRYKGIEESVRLIGMQGRIGKGCGDSPLCDFLPRYRDSSKLPLYAGFQRVILKKIIFTIYF